MNVIFAMKYSQLPNIACEFATDIVFCVEVESTVRIYFVMRT